MKKIKIYLLCMLILLIISISALTNKVFSVDIPSTTADRVYEYWFESAAEAASPTAKLLNGVQPNPPENNKVTSFGTTANRSDSKCSLKDLLSILPSKKNKKIYSTTDSNPVVYWMTSDNDAKPITINLEASLAWRVTAYVISADGNATDYTYTKIDGKTETLNCLGRDTAYTSVEPIILTGGPTSDNENSISFARLSKNGKSFGFIEILIEEWDDSSTKVDVTFHNGTETEVESINPGSKVTEPVAPTKEGHEFDGWYKENTYITKFDFNEPVNESIDLYAKFVEISIVSFYNGDELLYSQNVRINEKAERPIIPPEINGKVFTGWYSEPTLENEFDFNQAINSSVSIYAGFRDLASYTVVFYLGEDLYQFDSVYEGQEVSKPNNPEGLGYIFGGWYQDADYQIEFDFEEGIMSDTDIYGKIISTEVYSVTFTVEGNLYKTKSVNANGTISLPDEPIKQGYSFIKWIDNETGATFTDSVVISRNINCVAVFEKLYIISWSADLWYENEINPPVKNSDITSGIIYFEKSHDFKVDASINPVKWDERTIVDGELSFTKYFQTFGFSFNLTEDAYVSFYLTQTASNTRQFVIFKSNEFTDDRVAYFQPVDKPSNGGTVNAYKVFLRAGSYYTSCYINDLSEVENGRFNIYSATIEYARTIAEYQTSSDNSALRVIGTISNLDTEVIKSVKLLITLDNHELKEHAISTIYTSVKGDYGKEEEENTYYAILAITGLCSEGTENADSYELKVQLVVETDDIIYESNVITVTIYAVPQQ